MRSKMSVLLFAIFLGFSQPQQHINTTMDINIYYPNMIINAGFDSDTSGWSAGFSAALSSVSGGHIGNCLKVLENGSSNPQAFQEPVVMPGGQYRLSFYHKDIDSTGTNPLYLIYDVDNSAVIKSQTEAAAASWTKVSYDFTAPAGCNSVYIMLRHQAANGDGNAYYFDTVRLVRIG